MTEPITIPYQFVPRSYQLEYLASPARFKIVVLHRRAGKSACALNGQIIRAVQRPGVYYFCSPTYSQAKRTLWDELVRKHIPPEITKKINESELTIYYKNGSIQRFIGCEDWNRHRGSNPIDIVFDEYSEMDEKIWSEVFQPVLRENGGTASFLFTPKGYNHSWKILQLAKTNSTQTSPDGCSGSGGEYWWMVRGYKNTNVFTSEQIKEAKLSTTEAIFNQEYSCDFLSSSGAFFRGIDEVIKEDKDTLPQYPQPGRSYILSADLAKFNDFSVLTVLDLNTLEVVEIERFNQVDFNLQRARIEAMARKWNNALLRVDRTGVGEAVCEELARAGLNFNIDVDGIKFTQRIKNDLYIHLAIMIEQRKIILPNNPILINELKAMRYEMTENGRLKFGSVAGCHDDCVASLALALHGVTEPLGLENLPVYTISNTPAAHGIKLYASNSGDSLDKFSCF